ncbi:MAG: tail fiber domain-containing protein [bacterium]|nr:tail fiber domain-containing protein [bacterium]
MPIGAGYWLSACDSTLKQNFEQVNTADILDKVKSLPIRKWNYKSQDASIKHIGPMAQDFYSLFEIGDNNKSISTIDPDGVALAAIQELAKRLESVERENTLLRTQVQSLLAGEKQTNIKLE